MAHPTIPHTPSDVKAMLDRVGAESPEQLYADVPGEFLLKEAPALPQALSETEIREFFARLEEKNPRLKTFVGAGAYDHYTPAVVPYLCQRSEFLTAYTPYQCEISQGTLRYIFEYQSLICNLTGMDVSNASLYDGPTAAAEAVMMAVSCAKKKDKVLVSGSLLPQVREVVETYARYHGVKLESIAHEGGQSSLKAIKAALDAGDVAGVLVPSVNRFGIVEDLEGFADAVHAAGALLICYCDPSALAVVKTPAAWGADIAVGEAQSLGLPLSYGGPYLGFMAVRKDYMRKMPGRIVGQTADKEGRRAFVLTLQAREQHIRREKATSNICSNESLMALWATIYLSLMGPDGLKEVNAISSDGAHYLQEKLLESGAFRNPFPGRPFIKEFVLEPVKESAEKLHSRLCKAGFLAALPTEEGFVSFCVTEKRSLEEVDSLIKAVKEG